MTNGYMKREGKISQQNWSKSTLKKEVSFKSTLKNGEILAMWREKDS